MVGGGVLGSLLGLQGGLVFWLLQYITGETVEERWRREYVHHQGNSSLKLFVSHYSRIKQCLYPPLSKEQRSKQ